MSAPDRSEKSLLTTEDLCRRYGIKRRALRYAILRGDIPAPRRLPGMRRNLWRAAELLAWENKRLR